MKSCSEDLATGDVGVRTTNDGLGAEPTLLILDVRETLPENPKTPVTVIVAEPVLPGRMGMVLGVTDIVKPDRLKDKMNWCESRLLLPVTVMLYFPGGVSVEVETVITEVVALLGLNT